MSSNVNAMLQTSLYPEPSHPLVPWQKKIAPSAELYQSAKMEAALKPVPPRRMTTTDAIQKYSKHQQDLRSFSAALTAWLDAIVLSAFESPDNSLKPNELQEMAHAIGPKEAGRVSCCTGCKPIALKPAAPLAEHLSGLTVPKTQEFLVARGVADTRDVLEQLRNTLLHRQWHLLVGSVRWYPGSFAGYTFFTISGKKRLLGTRQQSKQTACTCWECQTSGQRHTTTTTQTVSDYAYTVKHDGHYHEIHNARLLPWNDKTLPKPPRVERLLQATPELLRPFVNVLVGDQFLQETVTVDCGEAVVSERHIETRTEILYRPQDPAVVFGPFVLAGW